VNDQSIRKIIIDALHEATGALSDPELALRLQDPKINLSIADLGISSLDAVAWCMEIEARSGVEVEPPELFVHGSIDGLVGLIVLRGGQAGSASDAPQLVRVPRGEPLPLSFTQERIWRTSQTPEESAAFAVRRRDLIVGSLDVPAFRDCLSHIVKRHEILRTTFAVADGQPVQIIQPAESVALPVFDLTAEADREKAAERIVRVEMAEIVDLTRGPLIRFSLMRISDNEHWFLRVCHHILWDTWSGKMLLSELARLYPAKLEGGPSPLPEFEPLQFADYASWQRSALRRGGSAYQETIAWWRERFEQPTPRPTLPFIAWWKNHARQPKRRPGLPFERPAPLQGLDPTAGGTTLPVDSSLAQRLARLRHKEGATNYVAWLAALVVLLAAETGQPNVTIGTYMTHRRRATMQNIMGDFTNLVTLTFQCDHAMSFRAWLSEVRLQVMGAEAHSEIPIEELRKELQALGVASPYVQIIFAAPEAGDIETDIQFAGLRLTLSEFPAPAVMPWGFSVIVHERNGVQECATTFDAGRYDPALVRGFIGRLHELLDAVSRQPDRPIGELLALREAV